MCFFCWIKPSSVLESNILFPTHVIPTHLTKVGCVLFPDSGQEPGGPSLPGVPTSLKGPGVCLLCHMEAKARQRTGLHVQLWLMKSEFWNDGKSVLGLGHCRRSGTWLPLRAASCVLHAVSRPVAWPHGSPRGCLSMRVITACLKSPGTWWQL